MMNLSIIALSLTTRKKESYSVVWKVFWQIKIFRLLMKLFLNDHSLNDGTFELAQEYQTNYPSLIKPSM